MECILNIKGKTLKGFIADLERNINKFYVWNIDTYALIVKKKVILTEEYDFEKIRDLIYLTDEEFLISYNYLFEKDLPEFKAEAFNLLKGVLIK